MRVIGGTYRSRVLVAPRGSGTRPTSDRLRETLFNILAPRIKGAVFADLYAGSGAVGIEALSRGAEYVYFAERAAPAAATIQKNLAALRIEGRFRIESRGAAAWLQRMAESARGIGSPERLFDIVFFDPPWEAAAEYSCVLELLGGRVGEQLLADEAVVIAEHAARTALPERVGGLARTRTLKQGDAALSFYQRVERGGDGRVSNS